MYLVVFLTFGEAAKFEAIELAKDEGVAGTVHVLDVVAIVVIVKITMSATL